MLAQGDKRIATVMPTGTGKFYLTAKIADDNPDKRILVVTPSLIISDQQVAKFTKLYSASILSNIEFITFSKLAGLDRGGLAALCPQIIVVDEFHHIGADVWGEGIKALCEAHPHVPVLGFSATPFRPSDGGRDIGEEFFGGNYAERLFIWDAWKSEEIPIQVPKYITAIYEWEHDLEIIRRGIEKVGDERRRAEYEREYEELRHSLESGEGIEGIFARHLPKADGRYIFFCSSVDHLNAMMALSKAWFLKANKKLHFYKVHYFTPDSSQAISRFESDDSPALKVMFAVDMLTEGIHVECDGIIMSRPTGSMTVYVQQLGRVLGIGGGKNPVVFDLVNNIESQASIAGFLKEKTSQCDSQDTVSACGASVDISQGFTIIDETFSQKQLVTALYDSLRAQRRLSDDLLAEWHPTRNTELRADEVFRGSQDKAWWLCPKCGHEYDSYIFQRSRGVGCPVCAGVEVVVGKNDLKTLFPDIARQWHPTKNGRLKPEQFAEHSHKDVWWQCDKGFEWERTIGERTRFPGCPRECSRVCDGRPTSSGARGVNYNAKRNMYYPVVSIKGKKYYAGYYLHLEAALAARDDMALLKERVLSGEEDLNSVKNALSDIKDKCKAVDARMR